MATHYVWDPIEDNVIKEYDDAGNTLVEYTTEPTLYGSVISQNRGGVTSNYHFDGLGNTTELTDESGNVTDTWRYSAFGVVTSQSGNTTCAFQFGGRYGYFTDSQLSPISTRGRDYAISSGRFISLRRERLSRLQSSYAYARGNPLRGILTGLIWQPPSNDDFWPEPNYGQPDPGDFWPPPKVDPYPDLNIEPPYPSPSPQPCLKPVDPGILTQPAFPTTTCKQFLAWLTGQASNNRNRLPVPIPRALNCGAHVYCGGCHGPQGTAFVRGNVCNICLPDTVVFVPTMAFQDQWLALLIHEATHCVQFELARLINCANQRPPTFGGPINTPPPGWGNGTQREKCRRCEDAEEEAYRAQAAHLFPDDRDLQDAWVAAGICHSCNHVCDYPRCPPFPEWPPFNT